MNSKKDSWRKASHCFIAYSKPNSGGWLGNFESRGRIWLSDLGRQDAAAEVRRREIGLSAAEASGGLQRLPERFAPCGQGTFHVHKMYESLGDGKMVWETTPLQSCPFPVFVSSQDSAQDVWMLRKQDFLTLALSLLFNTSQIHLFPLVSFGLG